MSITTTTAAVTTTLPTSTTSPVATTEASTSTSTIASTTTTEPPPVGWQPIDALPTLAYPPCCGANWSGGPPSPPIPADASVPLSPGLYHATRVTTDTSTDSITFTVSRYELCSELPTDACESQPPGDGDLGIEPDARGYTLTLDDTVRVGVSGFGCVADQQTATGAELKPLMAAFDESYDQLLGQPFTSGDSPDDLFDALAKNPTGGFLSPGCSPETGTTGALVWRATVGPPVLMQVQFAYDSVQGKLVVPKSASAEWLRLTSLEIAKDGSPTLYFYAGYYP